MSVLETQALTRTFGRHTAVDAMTISVEPGEVFGLLGPNGAGKSTAIKMLTTLLPPTSGTARVAGCDIRRNADGVRRQIGYVPQTLSVDGSLTGYESLMLFAKLYDVPPPERQARVRAALAFFGLADAADKLARQYSGGMIRRLELAQSTLHLPRLLFLDEPTIGLDPPMRRALWGHIQHLRSAHGMTIFLTTQSMDEADSLCSRVAIMHAGRVVIADTPGRLKVSVGKDRATLGDVFVHYAGDTLEAGVTPPRDRRTAKRLG